MKRLLQAICVLASVGLVVVIVLRAARKGQEQSGEPTQHRVAIATEIAGSFSTIKTRPLTPVEFTQAVRGRVQPKLDALSESERQKLLAFIGHFYACYSSGAFKEFKQFRLKPPFNVSERLASAVKDIASKEGLEVKSDEDILRIAWERFNGANRIGGVSEENLVLSIVNKQDLGSDLRWPSVIERLPGLGSSCWEGSVIYQPAPAELLSRQGHLRLVSLQAIVRFNTLSVGPATPLVLVGYWDPTREDWMPLALCRVFHVGSYDTIF